MKRSRLFIRFARCLRTSSFALLALVAITLALPGQLSAALSGQECLDDSYLGSNTPACVSNDVRVSVVTVPDPVSCEIGQQLLVNLNATLISGATDRYDVGIYLAEGDHDAKATGGLCFRETLHPITTDEGALDFLGGAGPFRDTDGDFCGDIKSVDGDNILFIPNFLYTCRDGNNDGQADIGACLAWDNNSNTVCSGVLDAIPSTGSKCRCELLPLGNVFIAGKILVDKVTIPAGSAQSFEFQTNYGANFSLTRIGRINHELPDSDKYG